MKYMVIGGTGFLGSYICKQLLEEGHDVVCFGGSAKGDSIEQVLSPEEMAKLTLVQGDITDYVDFVRICKENKIEIIITTAALLLNACEQNVPAAINVNVMGMVHIFEAARLLGIKRVVYASSDSSLGPASNFGGKPATNDAIHQPNCLYGMTKCMDEFIGKFYNERYGLETVGLRSTTIYGMARLRGGANWIKALINDPTMGIPSEVPNGDTQTNVIYVKDGARIAILASRAKNLTSHVYAATGDFASVAEMREYVLTLMPEAQIRLLPGKLDVAPVKYDLTLEERDLGYKPEYTYQKGIKETINNIRKGAGLSPL